VETDKVPTEKLEIYVNQVYHWKTLNPDDVMKIAKELLEIRKWLEGADESQ
jgi:hypothetical protein